MLNKTITIKNPKEKMEIKTNKPKIVITMPDRTKKIDPKPGKKIESLDINRFFNEGESVFDDMIDKTKQLWKQSFKQFLIKKYKKIDEESFENLFENKSNFNKMFYLIKNQLEKKLIK